MCVAEVPFQLYFTVNVMIHECVLKVHQARSQDRIWGVQTPLKWTFWDPESGPFEPQPSYKDLIFGPFCVVRYNHLQNAYLRMIVISIHS